MRKSYLGPPAKPLPLSLSLSSPRTPCPRDNRTGWRILSRRVGEGAIFIYTIDQRETVIYDRGYVTASRCRPPRRCVARCPRCSHLTLSKVRRRERRRGIWGSFSALGCAFFPTISCWIFCISHRRTIELKFLWCNSSLVEVLFAQLIF